MAHTTALVRAACAALLLPAATGCTPPSAALIAKAFPGAERPASAPPQRCPPEDRGCPAREAHEASAPPEGEAPDAPTPRTSPPAQAQRAVQPSARAAAHGQRGALALALRIPAPSQRASEAPHRTAVRPVVQARPRALPPVAALPVATALGASAPSAMSDGSRRPGSPARRDTEANTGRATGLSDQSPVQRAANPPPRADAHTPPSAAHGAVHGSGEPPPPTPTHRARSPQRHAEPLWEVFAEDNLEQTIRRWADSDPEASWQIDNRAAADGWSWIMSYRAQFQGTFSEALDALQNALSRADPAPNVELWLGNHTIVIRADTQGTSW